MLATVASTIDQFNMDNISILQSMGYNVDVACNFENGSTTSIERVKQFRQELKDMDVNTYHVASSRKISDIKSMRKAYKTIKNLAEENCYDIVHCHTPICGVITRLACRKARKSGTNVIYTAHGFHFYTGAPKVNWMIYYTAERFCAKYTDCLITINQEDYNRAKGFKAKAVEYVPGIGLHTDEIQGVQVDAVEKRESIGVGQEDFFLVSVGELNENKNQRVIINALGKLQNPHIKYILCGIGNQKEALEELAVEKGVADNVIFLGYRNDVKEITSVADVFAFPSYREGLSVALMESMACGLPAVCSKIRGNVDLIQEGKGGFLYNPDDVDGFADGINRMFNDRQLCSDMGNENKQFVRNFDINTVKECMENIYTKYSNK